MEYSDIVEKINNGVKLSRSQVSGYQLIQLLFDKVVKDIVYKGIRYEINFVPITYAFTAINITEEAYPKFNDTEKLLEHFIHCYDAPIDCYVKLNEEYYKIVLDILETS